MEDFYLRYGMIIIGVAVVGILIAFAVKTTTTLKIEEDKREQQVSGQAEQVIVMINKLCQVCIKQKQIDRDCYILKAHVEEGIVNGSSFGESVDTVVSMTGPVSQVVKIAAQSGQCVVRQVG